MKIQTLLALGTITMAFAAINVPAADVLLSPRAAANVIQHASGIAHDATAKADTTIALSPRAAASEINSAPTVANDFNMALNCRKVMTASPRAINACEANPAMPCCTPTVAVANP
jgi:hypothetical protein